MKRNHGPLRPRTFKLFFSLSFCLSLLLPAFVQAAEDRSMVVEEILVTGTKREQAAQDVPIAVTAISEEQIKRQFRTDILALGEMTPGVALGQVAGFRAIAGGVRGTGQNSILVTQDSSVVVLVDEFALSNVQAQFVEMFDVDRVEIYRGPQGTLFGKSATGGAISIITKRPVMNEYSADLEMQYGVFNGDDGPNNSAIEKYRAAVNIPLIEDKLSMRMTAILDKDEGYYTNDKNTSTFQDSWLLGFAPVPSDIETRTTGSGENLNDTDVFAGKIKILFQPTENYEAYFLYEHLNDDSGSPPGVNESEPTMLLPALGFPSIKSAGHGDVLSTGVTNQCFEGNSEALCVTAGHRVDVDGYQLHQTLTLDHFVLKAIAGYRNQEEILPSTYTGEAYASLFDASRNTTREQTQYEIRATSTFDGPFNFVAGVSYAEEETEMLAWATVGLLSLVTFVDEDRNDGIAAPLLNPDGTLNLDSSFQSDPAMGGASQDRETTAIYADGSYEVNDRLTLTAGLRYTDDEKDFFRRANSGGPCTALTPMKDQVVLGGTCLDARSNAVSRVGVDFSNKDLHAFHIPLPNSAFAIADKFNDSWDEITYRLVADYDVSDDAMVYVSYATGFIPGGYTETCSSLETCEPFDSETNWNAEVGFKGQFLNNSLQTNVALFYTEYEDLIRSQVVPFTDPFGLTTQETINVNAGVSQAQGIEIEGTWLVTGRLQLGLNFAYLDHEYDEFELDGVDFSNRDVPFSPEFKWGASATYEQEIAAGTLTWNALYSHQDEVEMSVFNSPLTQMSEWDIIDANVTYRPSDERYFVTLWGKNLTDERTRMAANSVAGLWNFTMYGRPLSYGLELGVSF